MQFTSEILNTYQSFKSKYGKGSHPIYWIFLSAVIILFISLPLIKVDITSQSRGIIRSITENNKIVSVVGGKITYVNLHNNQQVKEGDTLLVIDDRALLAELQMQEELVKDYSERLHDLDILCKGTEQSDVLYTHKYQQAFFDYKKALDDKILKAEQTKREFDRNKRAFDMGAISDVEYHQFKDQYESALTTLESFKENKLFLWRDEEINITNQLLSATANVDRLQTERKHYYITAPISGTTICLYNFDDGTFVYSGQQLVEISPDDKLIVECYVSPKDIGYIFTGQNVSVQYDAFDYNQWGLGKATVIEIDNNPRTTENQTFFLVRCKLHSMQLCLKNGYVANLRKGMTLTGRFTLTQRTLWQLLYDKIDDWFNPKIISNAQN